jgi:hypothetical protein
MILGLRSIFEPLTSRIRGKNTNRSVGTFCEYVLIKWIHVYFMAFTGTHFFIFSLFQSFGRALKYRLVAAYAELTLIEMKFTRHFSQYQVSRKYRVSTKELYTFKMIQKTNAAYLELHTYISR